MKQIQLSYRQSSFFFCLVHQGKGLTEALRFPWFAAPRQRASTLTQSPKIRDKIRQERNKGSFFLGSTKRYEFSKESLY